MIFNSKFNNIELKEKNKHLIFRKYNEEKFDNVEIKIYSINDNISNQLKIKFLFFSFNSTLLNL